MKRKIWKKLVVFVAAGCLLLGLMTGCGNSANSNEDEKTDAGVAQDNGSVIEATQESEHQGTIMWLSNLTSGPQYEAFVAYMTQLCNQAGYEFQVVYGDVMNDAANNLQAVKNNMTDDVVALIVSMDGGLSTIMEEYPDLYVVGTNADMNSVYDESGENHQLLENDYFLGAITDMTAEGNVMAQNYMNVILDKGYKKISIVRFPGYAYPGLEAAANILVQLVDEYNQTADDPIEVVGETTVLEFSVLEDSWFLEEGKNELDCIVAFCEGTAFVYPTLATAKSNGICSADTQMMSAGFSSDADIIADIGEERTIGALMISPTEDMAFALCLIDNALYGTQYPDWTNDRQNSAVYRIDSVSDIDNVIGKSILGTGNAADVELSTETVVSKLLVRNNPDATYADMMDALLDISVDHIQ